MKINPQKQSQEINEKQVEEKNKLKRGFLKKVWYSVTKLEKYSELSAEGLKKSLIYLLQITSIFAIIISLIVAYKANVQVNRIAQYINDNIPELIYKDEVLNAETNEVIMKENEKFGKIIIDTNTEDEEQIKSYLQEVDEDRNGIIILKNKLILKQIGLSNTVTYEYKNVLSDLNITEFNKQQLVEYLTTAKMFPLYLNMFILTFISQLITIFITTLTYIILISILGYITTMLLKLKIRYVAIFNIAIYSITLSTILYMFYLANNLIFGLIINYFDIMYTLLATIYMIAAIFILKIDFSKKQGEVQKIVEVEKQTKEENEEKNLEDKENKDDKKDELKKRKDENTEGEEPEGSNA